MNNKLKKYFENKDNIINVIMIILIFLLLIIFMILIFKDQRKYKPDQNEINKTLVTNVILPDNNSKIYQETVKYNWQINIPKLDNLVCPIKDGTDNVTLRSFVGHIKETSFNKGNICLAAHTNTANYKGNFYFNDLNKLEIGDIVFYKYYNNYDRKFIVSEIKEVDENDVSVLDDSNEEKLTLITCIKGKHNKRLIVVCQTEENFLKSHSQNEIKTIK